METSISQFHGSLIDLRLPTGETVRGTLNVNGLVCTVSGYSGSFPTHAASNSINIHTQSGVPLVTI